MLGKGRKNVDHQAVGIGGVGGHEVNAAFHEGRDERDVSREPVKLGD